MNTEHPTANNGAENVVNGNGHAPIPMTEAHRAALEVIHYWSVLRRHWMIIFVGTIGAAFVAWFRAANYVPKTWRAYAIITPVSPGQTLGADASSALPGQGGGISIASLFSIGSDTDNLLITQRYIAIMKSVSFSTELNRRYNVVPQTSADSRGSRIERSPWSIHQQLSGAFDTSYDYQTGNLTLYYSGGDPQAARRMLGYYIDTLREKLRGAEVDAARAESTSLQDEINKTPDALLQHQLYELVARQIQREKLAQVEADFAFKIVDAPLVPDTPSEPHPTRSAKIAGLIALFGLCGLFLLIDFSRRIRFYAAMLSKAPADFDDHQYPTPAEKHVRTPADKFRLFD